MDKLSLALNKAVQDFPNHAEFFGMRAKTMIQMGRIDQARLDLERTIQLNPFDSEAFDNLGVIEQMNGNYLRASELHLSALNSAPNNLDFLFNLAVALENLDQVEQAMSLYQSILEINSNHVKSMINLASHYEQKNEIEQTATLLEKALSLETNNFEAAMGLGNLYRKLEQFKNAQTYYERALTIHPTHGAARFMLANVNGETPNNAPTEYISSLFDDFADSFEDKLLHELEYRAPTLLYDAIKSDLDQLKCSHNSLKSIDLGAGTGLFGKMIRDDITLSIGVDLSQKMLKKAQEKKIYDDIICGDIIDALKEQNDHSCHLISAADVFVYVGALESLFEQVKRVLHPAGLFTFTIEVLDDSEIQDFILLETARYAHSLHYIKKLAQTHELVIDHVNKTWLRMNKKAPINGAIYVIKKKND